MDVWQDRRDAVSASTAGHASGWRGTSERQTLRRGPQRVSAAHHQSKVSDPSARRTRNDWRLFR